MANIIPPRRGEFLTQEGRPTQRFITWIETLSTDVSSVVNITESTSNAAVQSQIAIVRHQLDELKTADNFRAQIAALSKRISDLEAQQ